MIEQAQQTASPIQYRNHKPLKCWQRLLSRGHHYSDLPDRKIITNIPDLELPTNEIETSKYNILTFFPLNLMQQFTKPSNIYFLLIGILQIIPQITISEGKPTMFLPLTIVVAVSMVKDFIEDWRRHKSDRKENNSLVQVVSEIGLLKRKWEDIRVGQIIKVNKEQYFPCDTLLLHHSQQSNVAYIQTKNLDGENNLKLKKVPDCLIGQFSEDWLQISNLRYEVSYEKPNPFLNVFNGNIKVDKKKHMLDNNNVVLRGCSLKINEYVIGMCLYNGHQSKILLNSANPKPKRSYIESYLNSYFKYIFIFQLCVTLLSATAYGIILATHYNQYTYFNEGKEYFVDTIFTWGSWFISFSNFIPISLLVTLEVVRFGQGKILQNDERCKSKDFMAEVQTSSVNDDLGQIEYVLSDKTGTLTQNQMDFKFLYVNGVSYGENELLRFDVLGDHTHLHQDDYQESLQNSIHLQPEDDEPKIKAKLVEQVDTGRSLKDSKLLDKKEKKKKKKSATEMKTIYNGKNSKEVIRELKRLKNPNVDFPESQKRRLLQNMKSSSQAFECIRLALVHLALCHNVICEEQQYTSSSPDEVALASFARYIGWKFVGKTSKNQLLIEETIPGRKSRQLKYELLHTLEFSSERKRMSVIVRETQHEPSAQGLVEGNFKKHKQIKYEDNDKKGGERILLLCKGADDVILKRLSKQLSKQSQVKKVHDELFNYACKGLRTLVLAYRQLQEQEFSQWDSRYNEALTIITAARYQKVVELQSQIQQCLEFVAITAIEDKLQEEVKETISQLKKSSIKVWMLTGDKKETAISIGYSCGLIDPTNEIITLDCDPDHAKDLIRNVKEMLHMIKEDKVTVLSGEFITQLDDLAKEMLQEILKQSVSVICCRVSPKGKEEVTSMVKKWGRTLAIGDGANDVNMINSAHVGVGVRGIEGSQATRAADYVISEFKHLKRLVLFYGMNFYHRNCGVILFTLYKNILVTFPILFYGPLSIESAVFIYEMWIFQFYNIFFSALPIVYFGLFDTVYSQKELQAKPYLYSEGQQNNYFNGWILVRQILTTIVSSIFVVLTVYYLTNFTIIENGLVGYGSWSGMFIFNIVIITVNVRIWNMSHQVNFVQILLCVFGIAMYYACFFLIGVLFYTDVKNTLYHQVTTWLYWIMVILYVFAIEGMYHIISRINFIDIKTNQLQRHTYFKRDVEMKMLRRETIHLQDIAAEKRMSIGGYAFAEDEQRSLQFI